MKWGWEDFAPNMSRYMKLSTVAVKREDGLWVILSTLFLLVLISIVFLTAASERETLQLLLLGSLDVPSGIAVPPPVPPGNLDEPAIKGTSIVGRESVEEFRRHLDCFSESGKWVYDPTPRHIPWNSVGDPYINACEERHGKLAETSGYAHVFGDLAEDIAMGNAAGDWLVREELKWVWQTNSSCPWRPINRDEFCRKIGVEGHLMVVGDSINNEIQWSLMNALITNGSGYQPLDSKSRFSIGPYEMCGDILGNGKGFTVSFICNAFLTTDGEPNDSGYILEPWIDRLDDHQTKILLLNRGAHYQDDESLTSRLRGAFSILAQRYPHIHVIYRNTPPGHLDCSKFKEPLDSPQEGWLPFHWEDFNRQNLLTKEIVEEFEYTYMDVYTMLSLRPEAHISEQDCLHYCLPGPLDIATEYMYNILLLL